MDLREDCISMGHERFSVKNGIFHSFKVLGEIINYATAGRSRAMRPVFPDVLGLISTAPEGQIKTSARGSIPEESLPTSVTGTHQPPYFSGS